MVHHPKTVAERRGKKSRSCCRTDQSELRKIKTDRSGGSSLPNHNVNRKILHRRVKNFLHLTVQTMDLIHEEDIPLLKIIKDCRHLARFLDRRAGCYLHMSAHLIGNDPG